MAWVLVVQTVLPNMVMAQELGEEITTEETGLTPTEEITTGPAEATATTDVQAAVTTVESGVETETQVVETQQEIVKLFDESVPEASPAAQVIETSEEASESGESTMGTAVNIANESEVLNLASASAATGNNTQTSSGVANQTLATGDAVALATATSVVNTTLINSSLKLGTVVIPNYWEGDLVLDPGELSVELPQIFGQIPISLVINNAGEVITQAVANASTGDNDQIANGAGTSSMQTGEAVALASSAVMANTVIMNAKLLTLLTKNMWLWSGKIINWEYPGSVSDPQALAPTTIKSNGECQDGCVTEAAITNEATVVTRAEATATTGGNTQISDGGEQVLTTGSAYAGATATAVVNTTLVNADVTILHLLLFAPWTGNLVFAYPDLVTEVVAPATVIEGQDILYTIKIRNKGYKTARGVSYNYQIVNDEHEVGDGDEELPDLMPGEELTRTVSFDTTGRAGHIVRLTATALGENTEESTSNNMAIAVTQVEGREVATKSNVEEGEQETTKLSLTSTNNAENGVYPGDGITYDMDARNDGPLDARNVVVVQEFYTPDHVKISELVGKVGELNLNKQKHIRFVMSPSANLIPENYYTLSFLVGESAAGREIRSNVVRNEVKLLARARANVPIVGQAQAAETDDKGVILGEQTETPRCKNCRPMPWYVGLTIGSLAYYWITRRRNEWWQVWKWGLTLPLAGYAGLLLTQGDCRQGLVLIESASLWCKYYLPIGYTIYSMTGMLRRWGR